ARTLSCTPFPYTTLFRSEWRHQTNPIECEARGTASDAILLSSGLFRKDFLWNVAVGAAMQHCPRTTVFPPIPTRISSNSSKIVGDRAVETAALTKLRRTDTDAAAVAQLVDRVEDVDHIETDFDGSPLRDLDSPRQAKVIDFVRMIFLCVGK